MKNIILFVKIVWVAAVSFFHNSVNFGWFVIVNVVYYIAVE